LKAHVSFLVFLILLGFLAVPGSFIKAYASSAGLVCLADVSSAPSPPSNPCLSGAGPVFDGPVNQQIRIGVFVNGSGGFNGFDIALKANSSVLKPAGVDLSGSILQGQTSILLECLGTFNFSRYRCTLPVDTADTLRLAVAGFQFTPTPSTGLLFTAIFNVTGTTNSAMSVGFQSGCAPSSDGSICVALVNGSLTPLPETVHQATFSNMSPPPFLTVSSTTSIIGPTTVGSTENLRLDFSGQNGWNTLGCPCPVALSLIHI